MVALSGLSINKSIYLEVFKLKKRLANSSDKPDKTQKAEKTRVNMRGQTEVKRISQKQKILSKNEIEEIKELYLNGVPSNEPSEPKKRALASRRLNPYQRRSAVFQKRTGTGFN